MIDEIYYECLFFIPGKTQGKKENKCKSNDTRSLANGLLTEIVQTLKPKEMNEFLANYFQPMIEKLTRPSSWNHMPQDGSRGAEFQGIVNPSNVCYMNASLQQLFLVPSFRYGILSITNPEPENIVEIDDEIKKKNSFLKEDTINDNLLYQYQRMLGFLELGDKQSYDSANLCFASKDFRGNGIDMRVQQDAQEFVNGFFDKLEEKIKTTDQKYLIDDIFQGKQMKVYKCMECGYAKTSQDQFYCLTLQANKELTNLEASLRNMNEGDIISGMQCNGCKKSVDVKKGEYITKAPNVLLLHLNKVGFNHTTFMPEKINSKFEFPDVLDINPNSFKGAMTGNSVKNLVQEDKENAVDLDEFMDIGEDDYIYRLVGTVIHNGAAGFGHYWSFINTARGKDGPDPEKNNADWCDPSKGRWRKFNDDKVTYEKLEEVKDVSFGGEDSEHKGRSAYMLVYERKTKNKLRVVENPPQFREASEAQDQPEKIKEIDFITAVEPRIPNWVKQETSNDNIAHALDRQIFNKDFFKLVDTMLKHISHKLVMTQSEHPSEYRGNFRTLKKLGIEIGHKVMFDFISHSNKNDFGASILSSMTSLFIWSDSNINFLGLDEDSIIQNFLQRALIDDDCKNFFAVMGRCFDQSTRFQVSQITSKAVNQGATILYNVKETADRKKDDPKCQLLGQTISNIMQKSMAQLKERSFQKQWDRLDSFFLFMREVATGGEGQAMCLLKMKDSVIVDLCDFMLMNESPIQREAVLEYELAKADGRKDVDEPEKRYEMGVYNNTIKNPVKFSSLVTAVSHLIRCKYTPQMIDLPDDQLPDTFATFKDQKNFSSVDKDAPHLRLPERIELTQDEIDIFTHEHFMEMVLFFDFNAGDYGKALAHLCFGNEELSMLIARRLTSSLRNCSNYYAAKSVFECLEPYIMQMAENSDLPQKRLEWVFGWQQLCGDVSLASIQQDKTIVGVEFMYNNIEQEVYETRSSLTFNSKDESVLNSIWQLEQTFLIYAMQHLAKMLSSNEKISAYVAALNGPTYQWARFTDWMIPEWEEFLEKENKKVVKNEKLIDAANIGRADFRPYEEYIAKIDGRVLPPMVQKTAATKATKEQAKEPQEASGQRQNSEVSDGWSEEGEGDDDWQVPELAECQPPNLEAKEVEIDWSSKTDGDKQAEDAEKVKKEKKKPSRKTKQAPTGGEGESIVALEKSVIECKPRPYLILQAIYDSIKPIHIVEKDGVELVVYALECAWVWSYPTGIHPTKKTNLAIPDAYLSKYAPKATTSSAGINQEADKDKLDEPEEQKAQAAKGQELADALGKRAASAQNNADQPPFSVIVGNDDDLHDSFTEEKWGPSYRCEDLVYKVMVTNKTDGPILARVGIAQNEAAILPVNIHWPKTGINGALEGKESSVLAHLSKIVPSETEGSSEGATEIQKLVFSLSWEHDNYRIAKIQEAYEKKASEEEARANNKDKNDSSNKHLPAQVNKISGESGNEPQNSSVSDNDDNLYDDPPNGGFNAGGGEKECPACTFLNEPSATACMVCETNF